MLKFLNPTTGGKVRAALTVAVAVATWVIAILGAINWDAGVVASIPALIQVVTHFTPIGNTPPSTPPVADPLTPPATP